MAGKTIMPGIIDVHAHMSYDTLDIIPEQNSGPTRRTSPTV